MTKPEYDLLSRALTLLLGDPEEGDVQEARGILTGLVSLSEHDA